MSATPPRRALPLFVAALTACAACATAPAPTEPVVGPLITFVVTVPAGLPESATLDVKGNQPELGDWAASKGLALARQADGTYAASARFAEGTALEFKVTRGSWQTVMVGPNGEWLEDLRHTVAGDATVAITVVRWADQKSHTLSGTFEPLDVPAAFGLAARQAIVYLPPGYADDPSRRYPVLYLHDGQNVFDAATAFAGEWHADETAQTLIAAGKVEPLIMVGVYNTSARIDEYTPVKGTGTAASMGGQADAYGQLLVQTVKPLVDARYRTRPDAASTGLAGSSLGGLVSVYLALRYPDVFTRVGALSPSVWWADRHILGTVSALPDKLPLRIWLDMGTAESANATSDARALRDALALEGWTPDAAAPYETDLAYLEAEGAHHNEGAWSARFPTVLEYLFPAPR